MKIMKSTAIAPANIAFIKYWGKKDEELRLPLNSSISMNLSNCLTTTTVEFSDKYTEDQFILLSNNDRKKTLERNIAISENETKRVIKYLNRIRNIAKIKEFAKVVSENNFPSSSGMASSASGFAALTLAAAVAAGLTLSEKELTILARVGSGSACRSIPDGFVEWKYGKENSSSYAYSLYPSSYWDLRDIILLVNSDNKKVSSTTGMENVWTSNLMEKRLKEIPNRLDKIKLALKEKNFPLLGLTCEQDCLSMHKVANTQKPAIFYWTNKTEEIIKKVKSWRSAGLEVYFTVDAGPNVHLLCQGKDERKVIEKLNESYSGLKYIINKPTSGVKLTDKHLF